MSRRVTYFNSSFKSAFSPLDLAGTQLYFAKNTATPSFWNDQSPNGYDLEQDVASQQPTIGADSVDFDGVDDFLGINVTNPFSSHTQGTVFFSINAVAGVAQRILVVNNTPTGGGNNLFHISYLSNKIRLAVRNADGSINNIFETANTFGTGYLYGSISSDGSSYTLKVNGVVQSITFASGSNTGAWLSSITATNVIRIGLIQAGPTLLYGATRLNKLWYNNTALTSAEMTKLETFFSDPNNY